MSNLPHKPLNIFYEEPDPDRWLPYDRYPRQLLRRLIRGKQRPGGVMMIALNLMKGLDKIGIRYRFNDYRYINKHPNEIACIIGKPQVLFQRVWKNPIIFGAGIFSHPVDEPELLIKRPTIKRILVPGPWMQKMFAPAYGDLVTAWPTGIDTTFWKPSLNNKRFDFLIYDKVWREKGNYDEDLVKPIISQLKQNSLSYQVIKYGHYTPRELKEKLDNSKAAIFLSKNETQGLAYQQMLATNTPLLAWDRAGFWEDPNYYPHKVQFQPISSVPYWDERCGMKFKTVDEFEDVLQNFVKDIETFEPRQYILENLSLEACARKYVEIYHEVEAILAR